MENPSGSAAIPPETWLYYSQIIIYAYLHLSTNRKYCQNFNEVLCCCFI